MTLKTIILSGLTAAAIITVVAVTAAPAQAARFEVEGGAVFISDPSPAQIDLMWDHLAAVGYPSEIVAQSQSDYDAATKGWRTNRTWGGNTRQCDRFPTNHISRDQRVQDAKVLYCELRSLGYPIPKPVIVKDF